METSEVNERQYRIAGGKNITAAATKITISIYSITPGIAPLTNFSLIDIYIFSQEPFSLMLQYNRRLTFCINLNK